MSVGWPFVQLRLSNHIDLKWNKGSWAELRHPSGHKMNVTSGTVLSDGLSVVIFFSSFLMALSLFCFRRFSMFCCLTWNMMNLGIWRQETCSVLYFYPVCNHIYPSIHLIPRVQGSLWSLLSTEDPGIWSAAAWCWLCRQPWSTPAVQ